MNIFDILGPVMVGPSSSHTAGAVRIGYVSRYLLQEKPISVHIALHGSFASTGKGHGTDKALIAGVLGMLPDDIRIPDSFTYAKEKGLKYQFSQVHLRDAHPNTAVLDLVGESGKKLSIQAESVGGGRIRIRKIDGVDANFTAEKPTLIVHNEDKPGYVAGVTTMLSREGVNIASMQLYRDKKGGIGVMVLEVDQAVSEDVIDKMRKQDGIVRVIYMDLAV